MAVVVCQVLARVDRLTLLWSAGEASFEPYAIEGGEFSVLQRLIAQAHEQLAQFGAVADDAAAAAKAAGPLARIGHALFRLLFQLDRNQEAPGQEVRAWLEHLTREGPIERIEIVGDAFTIPWTMLHDQPPDQAELAGGGAEAGTGFWGYKYTLVGGRRVQWLRGRPLPAKLTKVAAIDRALRAGLPPEAEQLLAEYLQSHDFVVADTLDNLTKVFQTQEIDLLYLFGPAEGGAILLGNDRLTPESLEKVLFAEKDKDGMSGQTLVFLNAASAAGNRPSGNLLAAFERFSGVGLIGSWQPVSPALANQCGLEWLDQFVHGGRTLAQSLAGLRQRHGAAGPLYFACCPAQVHTAPAGAESDEDSVSALMPGAPSVEPLPLPDEPYQPLTPLNEDSAALLVGREFDVIELASLLDDGAARLLLVHGGPGVGKSSLLHAGVVPYLEDECIGYQLMRDRSIETESAGSEPDFPVLSIRASSDLAGQLALGLLEFCARPYSYATPTGKTISVDLPGMLKAVLEDGGTSASTGIRESTTTTAAAPAPGEEALAVEDLRVALRRDPELLGNLLTALTARLPFELVVLIEQGDELFSLIDPGAEPRGARRALMMLRAALAAPARAKFVVSLRTQFLGRFLDGLLQTPEDDPRVRTFLVRELTEDELIEVILQPTSMEPLPGTEEVPQAKYGFQFEQNLAQTIAKDARRLGAANQESTLVLVHAVCRRLQLLTTQRQDRVVRAGDLASIGGVEKGLSKYVGTLVKAAGIRSDRKALKRLLLQLFIRQPDGSLTRDLLFEAKVMADWQGATPFGTVATALAADNVRLLDVSYLNIGGKEGKYVSLGHDTLAPVMAQQAQEATRRAWGWTKMADALWITIPLIILLGVFWWVTRNSMANRLLTYEEAMEAVNKKLADQKETNVLLQDRVLGMRWPTYVGQTQAAQRAYQSGDLRTAREALLSLLPLPKQDDLRGFDWHYLWGLLNQDHATLYGHRGTVAAVAASKDGLTVATGSTGGTVALWDVARGSKLAMLDAGDKKAKAPVHCLAFSPDGTLLAAGCDDNAIRLWKVSRLGVDFLPNAVSLLGSLTPGDGGALSALCQLASRGLTSDAVVLEQSLTEHKGPVFALAFSPDGKSLASASKDGTVVLWDMTSAPPKVRQTLKEHSGPVLTLAYAPDGALLATGGADKIINIWEVETGKKKRSLTGHPQEVTALAWSDDAKKLASAGAQTVHHLETGLIKLWNTATWEQTPAPSFAVAPVFSVSFSHNGKTLITAAKDNAVQFWDVESGKEQFSLKGHLGWVRSLAVARGGLCVVSGSFDGTAKIWMPRALARQDVIQSSKQPVLAIVFSPDGRWLATGSADGAIKIWDVASAQAVKALAGHEGAVQALAWSADGKTLVSGGVDGRLKLWNVDGSSSTFGNELDSVKGHDKEVTCLAGITPAGRLASGGNDGSAKGWTIEGGKFGKEPVVVKTEAGPVLCLALHASNEMLATGHEDHKIRLWNTAARMPAQPTLLSGHTAPVTALVFSGEQRSLLFSASADRSIKLWNLGNATEAYTLRGHGNIVTALALSPKTRHTLVSGSTDRTVKLWEPDLLEERMTLTSHTTAVRAVAISWDATIIAAAAQDGTVRLWRAHVGPPVPPPKTP
jgi:WD40 repeat protein